jgi:hypothetical protein
MSNLLPPMPTGSVPGSSYWNDWYEKLRTIINTIATGFSWSLITGTPTTLAGYGITDAQTKLNNSAGLAAAVSDETGTGVVVFNNTPTLITPVLGAATGTSVTLTGDITTGTGTLHRTSVALTNGAAAAAGTLANAPIAGNPTKWVPINDNGTIRYIPCW